VSKYPTLPDAKQFRIPNLGFSGAEAAVEKGIAKQFPLILSRDVSSNNEGGGEETRDKSWACRTAAGHVHRESAPPIAADRGIRTADGCGSRAPRAIQGQDEGARYRTSGKGVAWMPFHSAAGSGPDLRATTRRAPIRSSRRKREHDHTMDTSGDRHAGAKVTLSKSRRHKGATDHGTYEILCDADRCIEMQCCVTACQDEHEVPWASTGAAGRHINDGQAGRAIGHHGLHALHRPPCAAVCR